MVESERPTRAATRMSLATFASRGVGFVKVWVIAAVLGATYLGKAARIGSIAPGKQADLVVIGGNPVASISDIRNVELVFKQGVGYDPAKLIASVKGKVGLF